MLQFENNIVLWLGIIIPILIIIYILTLRRRKLFSEKISKTLWNKLEGDLSKFKKHLKFLFLILALLLFIFALANPLRGTKLEEVKQEGMDIFIALDVSLSMTAEDVAPNRIEKAKFEINKLIGKLSGDKIGLIIFSGTSYIQLPLTIDYSAASMFVDVIGIDAVPTPGSIIEDAIRLAIKSFYQEKPAQKVLIIITDGESTEGDSYKAAEDAAKDGVMIYTIGIGTQDGTPIPIFDQYGKKDFKHDRSGNIVLTKLDETGLIQIANLGGGKYINSKTNVDGLDEIFKDLNKLQKREFGQKMFTEYETEFQYFGFVGLLFLLIEFFMNEKRSSWIRKLTFKKNID